jgi:hypothetical protein
MDERRKCWIFISVDGLSKEDSSGLNCEGLGKVAAN